MVPASCSVPPEVDPHYPERPVFEVQPVRAHRRIEPHVNRLRRGGPNPAAVVVEPVLGTCAVSVDVVVHRAPESKVVRRDGPDEHFPAEDLRQQSELGLGAGHRGRSRVHRKVTETAHSSPFRGR
jgi:hypothetical protein